MLADELDFVVGVDTHLDEHVLAVVAAATGLCWRGKWCGQTSVATKRRCASRAPQRGVVAPGRSRARVATAPGLRVTSPGVARPCSRSAVARAPSGDCAARTTRPTRRGRRGQRLPASRSRFRATGSDARRCDCYWSHVEAPSTCAAKRSDNFAV
jgi:hypothetical protein